MTELSTKAINTVRILAADMVQKANSGHPGYVWAGGVLGGWWMDRLIEWLVG